MLVKANYEGYVEANNLCIMCHKLALRMLPKRQHEEAVVVAGGWLRGCDAWVVAIAAVVVAVEEEEEEEEGGRSEEVWDWEEDGPSVFWE
ncbi:hypothetical protein E2C01_004956 [Portunus trituberculatus]|uniref:Uncharacterized protein n=1 Tax=Portunus trituberculatus TaxID=210409 RepID=A0A5B7CUC5_PORTR|nr:hypothetical protein [Portunus trituberculatus]